MSKELVKEGHGEYIPKQMINSKSIVKGKQSSLIKEYIEVTKVGIVRSNLLTVITGMWLAAGGSFANLTLLSVILTTIGSTAILASATTINNYIDRDIDQKMERTQTRALVAGRLVPSHVLIYGIILGVVGTIALLFVNLLTLLVAWIGLISYVGLYSLWTKRSHSLNTIVGSK